jgi:hypothetical protein
MKKKIIIGLVAVAVLVSRIFVFQYYRKTDITEIIVPVSTWENLLWILQPPVSWKQKIL